MAAALGFVVGLLVVGSVSMRRKRRDRRGQLLTGERELGGQVIELEGENTRLCETRARQNPPGRRLVGGAAAADRGSPAAAKRRVTVPSPPADRRVEPVYEEARRVACLRRDSDLSFLSPDDRPGPSRP
jgi:hypothetical protein